MTGATRDLRVWDMIRAGVGFVVGTDNTPLDWNSSESPKECEEDLYYAVLTNFHLCGAGTGLPTN